MRRVQLGDDANALSFAGTDASPTYTYNGNESFSVDTAGGLVLANVATASLPAAPATGTQFYDTTKAAPVTYDGSAYTAALSADGSEPLSGNWNVGAFTITATTFIGAVTGDVTGNVTGDVQGPAITTTEGSGWAGVTAYSSEVTKQGKVITTQIFVDIAGLLVSTTESDIIGDTGAKERKYMNVFFIDPG